MPRSPAARATAYGLGVGRTERRFRLSRRSAGSRAAQARRPQSRPSPRSGRAAGTMAENYRGGARSAAAATGGSSTMGTIGGRPPAMPPRVIRRPPGRRRMKRNQTMSHGATAAAHAVRSGDSHGGGASINLSEDDR